MTRPPDDSDPAGAPATRIPSRTPVIVLALVVFVAAITVIWMTESALAVVLLLPALLVLVRALVGVGSPNDGGER